MRGIEPVKTARYAVLALVAVMGGVIVLALPPAPRPLAPMTSIAPAVRGAFHIHTVRSDGTGTMEDVAAAAARAGLAFIIVTDHGDAMREPDSPAYRSGVLCIDAVEISTSGGHVVALGLPASSYPLAGEPRDVVADIHRLGGMAVAAHPGSAKPALQWVDWSAPVDGLEWLNADSEWRDEGTFALARALLTYPLRRTATLGALLDRPASVLGRWDDLLSRHRVVGLAAADAHARLALEDDAYGGSRALHVPSYEQMFRAFSIALPGASMTGDAATDASAVIAAIRGGRVFSVIDAIATPASVAFAATAGTVSAMQGGSLPGGMPAMFTVETNAPENADIALIRGGQQIARAIGRTLQHTTNGEPGAYRVEVTLPNSAGNPPVPWIVSNPIYVGEFPSDAPARPVLTVMGPPLYANGPANGWEIERSARAQAALDVANSEQGTELVLRYALGGMRSESPYVALRRTAGAATGYAGLTFVARASSPARVSIQLRTTAGQRWARSVYLDESSRDLTVFFDEMTPMGGTRGALPLDSVQDLLIVIDSVNTAPGSSGRIWIDDVAFAR
jgi:hypothetical protein